MMRRALEDLKEEIEHAKKWGTDFDDANTANDWSAYISIYCGMAIAMTPGRAGTQLFDSKRFRKNMLKVASLAMHAIEATDRGGPALRHYDKETV